MENIKKFGRYYKFPIKIDKFQKKNLIFEKEYKSKSALNRGCHV